MASTVVFVISAVIHEILLGVPTHAVESPPNSPFIPLSLSTQISLFVLIALARNCDFCQLSLAFEAVAEGS